MRKFNFKRGPRRQFFKKLANNLVMREKIETTIPRAKEIRPYVERLVTISKKQDLASFRTLLARLPKQSAQKLFYNLAIKYKDRRGGYLRIIKETKTRKRDGAQLAIIEFV